ncbi:MAG: hypothetical protein ACLVJ6_00360 [Merdibacter sp.]
MASIAHNGYADAIFPVHTMSDGDTIFTLAVNEVDAMPDVVGALAVHVMGKAINRAVLAAEAAYGLPSAAPYVVSMRTTVERNPDMRNKNKEDGPLFHVAGH